MQTMNKRTPRIMARFLGSAILQLPRADGKDLIQRMHQEGLHHGGHRGHGEKPGASLCDLCATGILPVLGHGQDGHGTSLVAAPPREALCGESWNGSRWAALSLLAGALLLLSSCGKASQERVPGGRDGGGHKSGSEISSAHHYSFLQVWPDENFKRCVKACGNPDGTTADPLATRLPSRLRVRDLAGSLGPRLSRDTGLGPGQEGTASRRRLSILPAGRSRAMATT